MDSKRFSFINNLVQWLDSNYIHGQERIPTHNETVKTWMDLSLKNNHARSTSSITYVSPNALVFSGDDFFKVNASSSLDLNEFFIIVILYVLSIFLQLGFLLQELF